MSTNGLSIFDRTVQSTNVWLDDIMQDLPDDRQAAWHALGAVLRAVRDELPVDHSAHLSAQLPTMIRGAFYDQWRPAEVPARIRSQDEFLKRVGDDLANDPPIAPEDAVKAVTRTLSRHIDTGQAEKVRNELPASVRELWTVH